MVAWSTGLGPVVRVHHQAVQPLIALLAAPRQNDYVHVCDENFLQERDFLIKVLQQRLNLKDYEIEKCLVSMVDLWYGFAGPCFFSGRHMPSPSILHCCRKQSTLKDLQQEDITLFSILVGPFC